MLSDVWKGTIKSALMVAFKKSSEPHIVIHKSPALKVKVKKHFKEGDFSIVGLTNHIAISHSKSNDLLLAECYNHPSFGPMKAYAKSHLQFPTKQKATGFARQQVEPFIVAYWACQESYDPAKANSEAKLVTTSIKIGGASHEIGIPTISNTKALNEGDEVIVLKTSAAAAASEVDLVEPDAKRHKGEKGKPAKGKGKGKGKGKAA